MAVFLKEEKIYISFCVHTKPIARNRVAKVEFTQTKNWLFEKGLGIKG